MSEPFRGPEQEVVCVGATDVVREGPARAFMLCNEAIVRGAIEADVKVVSAYPGSPTTEVLDTFSAVAPGFDYRMEISANEKVALETCAGASMAGFRTITSMKSVGLNVASDAFYSLSYTGIKGGMVLVVADDPQAHSSQTEQDGRTFGHSAYVPMLEPSDPAEAKRMVKVAFEISEKYGVPVLLRTTTRVNHQSGIVDIGKIERKPFKKVRWDHPPSRFVTVADSARTFKLAILERTMRLEDEFEGSDLNIVGDTGSDTGIITSGAGYNYSVDACRELGIKPSMLKLGTTYPLPKKLIGDFLKKLKTVIIVEELSPYLELRVTAIAKDANPSVRVVGKWTGHFSEAFEYNTNIVVDGIAKALGTKPPVDYKAVMDKAKELKEGLADRWPTFCPGCPHRASLHALRQALKGVKHVVATDIGCYSMSYLEPVNYGDTLLCMGACMGVAAGLQYAVEEKVVAIVGDSTVLSRGPARARQRDTPRGRLHPAHTRQQGHCHDRPAAQPWLGSGRRWEGGQADGDRERPARVRARGHHDRRPLRCQGSGRTDEGGAVQEGAERHHIQEGVRAPRRPAEAEARREDILQRRQQGCMQEAVHMHPGILLPGTVDRR